MPVGISKFVTTQKYHAFYFEDNKRVLIGMYDTEKEAIEARTLFNDARVGDVIRNRIIKRNAPRIDRINKILSLANGITTNELAEIMSESIQLLCRDLSIMTEIGYLSLEVIPKGAYNQPQNHYTKLKDKFDMSDIDILLAEILENKSGKRVRSRGRNAADVKEIIPGAKVFSIDAKKDGKFIHRDKYNQQAKDMRKKPVYGISGSGLSMF